ncbi:MAG: T9SS type A sorting domain-containing protein, partial [Ignavibacteriae bacterium]|nr:T9SS type A sorting domain-containing protein [Ignavibacteriota bacterium]
TKTILVSIADRWNLLSVPLSVPDYRKSSLFSSATSLAFAYEGTYVEKETLANGVGYWMKFTGVQNVGVVGNVHQYQSIPVNEGWNLVGSISDPLAVNMIASNPGGIVTSDFFEYKGGYSSSDTIHPGKGYWVKSYQAGTLTLSSLVNSHLSLENRIRIIPSSELPPPSPEGDGYINNSIIPSEFALKQNYPNPFNPTTNFGFQIANFGLVTLKIYNMFGQEITTLLNNQVMEQGEYELPFNATNFASGVYFYRINVESVDEDGIEQTFTDIKRMVLIK